MAKRSESMKYAIISDIHGNFPALSAVMKDAKSQNVDQYIFAGDYAIGFPYPNETVSAVFQNQNSRIIFGNGESYLKDLSLNGSPIKNDGQFQPVYWGYQTLTEENKSLLLSLPEKLTFKDSGTLIHVTHSSNNFMGNIERNEFSPSKIVLKYADQKPSHEALVNDINYYLKNNVVFQSTLQTLTEGIYIFGHTHIQWHARFENRIFINPGSCGDPLDFSVDTIPYTVLEVNGDNIDINERQIPFDRTALIREFRKSTLYQQANITSEFTIQQLLTGKEHFVFFIGFAEKYAQKIGDPVRPFSSETWNNAYKAWNNTYKDWNSAYKEWKVKFAVD